MPEYKNTAGKKKPKKSNYVFSTIRLLLFWIVVAVLSTAMMGGFNTGTVVKEEEKTTKSATGNPYTDKPMEKFREQMETSPGHRFILYLIDQLLNQPMSHAAMVWHMRDNLMNAYGLDEPTARGRVFDLLNELINADKIDEKLFMRFCIAMGIKEFELKITTKNTKKKDTKIAINDTFLTWE